VGYYQVATPHWNFNLFLQLRNTMYFQALSLRRGIIWLIKTFRVSEKLYLQIYWQLIYKATGKKKKRQNPNIYLMKISLRTNFVTDHVTN
jgi:hypothetical protein